MKSLRWCRLLTTPVLAAGMAVALALSAVPAQASALPMEGEASAFLN